LAVIAGVDEAGRGSVLGPLFIAGVAIEESELPKLRQLGVKDSKLLLPAKRRRLYAEIRNLGVQVAWEKINPERIDEVVIRGVRLMRLNYLEAQHMARVLSSLKFDLAYVDCCDTVQKRYGELVADLLFEVMKRKTGKTVKLGEQNPYRKKIVSEHHADVNYAIVSAASIIAKVRRDAYISLLQKKHGVFGSGYPSDPDTKKYLKGYVERSETLPSITRFSWTTIRNLYEPREKEPSLIDDYSSSRD
jgi:ribonuclease HII